MLVQLLDGSMGQELIRRGAGCQGELWAADALFNAPEAVREIHEDYIRAGADTICTNSYSAIPWKFEQAGVSDRLEEMVRFSGDLAVQARNNSGQDVLIAGSLPPLHGSYNPDRVLPYETMLPIYRQQVAWLADYVDLFLCETMSTANEALAAATAAMTTAKPVWVSWTLDDTQPGHLRSGETITEAHRLLTDLEIDAYLLNCSMPETITSSLPELVSLGKRAGAYANGFSNVSSKWVYSGDETLPSSRCDLDPQSYSAFAAQWIADGARIIGGCCEIGPAHIAELRKLIDSFPPN